MNISTEQLSQCNQSEPLADASGRMVDLINSLSAYCCFYDMLRSKTYVTFDITEEYCT